MNLNPVVDWTLKKERKNLLLITKHLFWSQRDYASHGNVNIFMYRKENDDDALIFDDYISWLLLYTSVAFKQVRAQQKKFIQSIKA